MSGPLTGLPVPGYHPQPVSAVTTVTAHKIEEERLLRRIDALDADGSADPQWLATARTYLELGFMALNRAVFKPGRIALPGDAIDGKHG